jgi:biotin carboxyl carrier protein
MARERKILIHKSSSTATKKEKKEKRGKKSSEKKPKEVNFQTADSHDTLTIEDVGYKTLLTKKYVNRKKYKAPDPNMITAFIPGTILKVFVKTGQKIAKGESLLILEAMKMNNKLVAPQDGTIKKVHVKEGEMVAREQLLIEIK